MVQGLCVTRVHLGAAVVLRPVGEFDLASVEVLRESLLSSIACMPCVVLDLSETGFLDSVCLGALVAGRKEALAAGGWVRLVQPSGAVHRILRLTNLDALFGVYATVDDALGGDPAIPEVRQPPTGIVTFPAQRQPGPGV